MRVLVLGAGVIGSVHADRLARAGHDVTVLARGPRLTGLRRSGLIIEDASTGRRQMSSTIEFLGQQDLDGRFDLIMVTVRRDQLTSTLPLLTGVEGDVLFFGNTVGRVDDLTAALETRALFGFPAAGGARAGDVVRYVTIQQQRTMLAEPSGEISARLRRLERVFSAAGFRTHLSADAEGWLMAHTAFVVPIGLALARAGVQPQLLAQDRRAVGMMVTATAQAFRVLRAQGNREIPRNLRALYSALPKGIALAYWRRVLAGPNGELWFAAHTRAAPEELRSLAAVLLDRVGARRAPALAALMAP